LRNLSKKYEHRIDALKNHKMDKDRKRHRKTKRKNLRNKSVNQQKKEYKDFRKKVNKSKNIW